MKRPRFTIIATFVVILCILSCCESRPSSGSNLNQATSRRPSIVDCGNYTVMKGSSTSSQKPRGLSLVSSLLRRGMFAFSYKRTNSCWRASNVTGLHVPSETMPSMQSVIQFSMDKSLLENLTTATLTMYLVYPDCITEDEKTQLAAIKVIGTASGVNGTHLIPKLSSDEADLRTDNLRAAKFDVLDLLLTASLQEDPVGGDSRPEEAEPREEKITIKFYVTRECKNLQAALCSRMFETAIHTPSLRVSYI